MDTLKNRQHIRILFPRTTETWNYPTLTLQSYAGVALYPMWKILLFPSKLEIFGSPQGQLATWSGSCTKYGDLRLGKSMANLRIQCSTNGKSDYSDIFPAKIKRYLAYIHSYTSNCVSNHQAFKRRTRKHTIEILGDMVMSFIWGCPTNE